MTFISRRALLMAAGVMSTLLLFTIDRIKVDELLKQNARVQKSYGSVPPVSAPEQESVPGESAPEQASTEQEQHGGRKKGHGHGHDPEEFPRKAFPGFNVKEIDDFRYQIIATSGALKKLYVAKSNIPDRSVRLTMGGKRGKEAPRADIPPAIYNSLPLGIFEHKAKYQSCSVVGNAGSLIDSGCGRQIDSADYVIRCNFPPVDGEYAKDVGKKTGFLSVNPSLFQIIYKNFKNDTYTEKFISDVKEYGLSMLYTHPYRLAKHVKTCYRAHEILMEAGMADISRFSHPQFLNGVTEFWKNLELKEARPSTGLLLTAIAMTKCKEVTLYGFWPFPTYYGQERPFHYFDRPVIWNMQFDDKSLERDLLTNMNPFHDLTEEFVLLNKLHEKGVLKLQIGTCG
ncbi:alpha-N-acetylneuraminide alpha-2,8-sialyltransferase-like [Branchiostoma lanceolatum]|uniref:alpha-N-acetylneuraminide alpha-2,8-sialyltransferase-like n=1 Tax=Branchiostoma lanceolatum TaxID=7740 RepID=UPI00345484FF